MEEGKYILKNSYKFDIYIIVTKYTPNMDKRTQNKTKQTKKSNCEHRVPPGGGGGGCDFTIFTHMYICLLDNNQIGLVGWDFFFYFIHLAGGCFFLSNA